MFLKLQYWNLKNNPSPPGPGGYIYLQNKGGNVSDLAIKE